MVVKLYWFCFLPDLLLEDFCERLRFIMDKVCSAEQQFLNASMRSGRGYDKPSYGMVQYRIRLEDTVIQDGIEIATNGAVATRRNLFCLFWAIIAFRSYQAEVEKEIRQLTKLTRRDFE